MPVHLVEVHRIFLIDRHRFQVLHTRILVEDVRFCRELDLKISHLKSQRPFRRNDKDLLCCSFILFSFGKGEKDGKKKEEEKPPGVPLLKLVRCSLSRSRLFLQRKKMPNNRASNRG